MSWKLRRAHYYARQKGKTYSADIITSKYLNLSILIGVALIILMLVVHNFEYSELKGFIGLLGILSLLITPFLLIIGLNVKSFPHGLPWTK